MVFSNDPDPPLADAGRAGDNAVSRIGSGPDNKIALHGTILPRAQADPALTFQDGVIPNDVPLGFVRDDFRLAGKTSVRSPDRMIKNVLFDNRPHIKGLDIADPNADGFKTIVRIASGNGGYSIPSSEIAVVNGVVPGDIDPAFADIRHDLDRGVATVLGSFGERAVLNRVVEATQTDPVDILTTGVRGSASGETEVGKSDVLGTVIRTDDICIRGGQSPATGSEIYPGKNNAAS